MNSLSLPGTLSVTGATTLGSLSVSSLSVNSLSLPGALSVTGATTLGAVSMSSLSLTNLSLPGTLSVTGATTLGAVSMSSLSLTNLSLPGTLSVTGSTTLGAVSMSSLSLTNLSLPGTLSVDGVVTMGGDLNVFGIVVIDALSALPILRVRGNSEFLGTLTVSGASTLTGNVSMGGTLSVTGASTLTGNVSMGGTLSVTGASTLTGNVSMGGTLSVTGATTLGATTVSSLSVSGASTLTGNVYTDGALTVNNEVSLTGPLNVINNATFDQMLLVRGFTNFETDVIIFGNLRVDSTVTINSEVYVAGNVQFASPAIVTVYGELHMEEALFLQHYKNIQLKNSTVTLTVEDLINGRIHKESGGSINYTVPTKSSLDTRFTDQVNMCFTTLICNFSNSGSISLKSNTGVQLIGDLTIHSDEFSILYIMNDNAGNWTIYVMTSGKGDSDPA